MPPFKLSHLDHVAIHVLNPDLTIKWYEDVLGLKKYQLKAWGEFPIFMLAGKVGIAIFPAEKGQPQPLDRKVARIDHFAFNLSNQDFLAARKHYESIGLFYTFRDHHYFHSIYTKDPDGHTLELTTQVVDDEMIYN